MSISRVFVFIGRSGCGKGTQASGLEAGLRRAEPEKSIIHLETGKLFRQFIQGQNYTNEISNRIYKDGGLQPEFLTVHLWSDFFVSEMKKDANIIIDGTPRRLNEAVVLDTAFRFYGIDKPDIIYLNVSREWSRERMMERNRVDDNKHDIESRLDWFDTEVMPAIDYYRENAAYRFHDIDGQRTIEAIGVDIAKIADIG